MLGFFLFAQAMTAVESAPEIVVTAPPAEKQIVFQPTCPSTSTTIPPFVDSEAAREQAKVASRIVGARVCKEPFEI